MGQLAMSGSHAFGSGIVIGEGCGLPGPKAYGDETGTWQITLDMVNECVDHGARGGSS